MLGCSIEFVGMLECWDVGMLLKCLKEHSGCCSWNNPCSLLYLNDNKNIMDKELALIISEMLIKQDETTAQIKETNSILRDFMGISVKQWEQQQTFNELMIGELKNIKDVLTTLAQVDTRLKAIEERESKFESRLANIEKLLKAS